MKKQKSITLEPRPGPKPQPFIKNNRFGIPPRIPWIPRKRCQEQRLGPSLPRAGPPGISKEINENLRKINEILKNLCRSGNSILTGL